MHIKGIEELLRANGIDPSQVVKSEDGEGPDSNAYTVVEAALMGAFEQIEDHSDD